MKSLETESWVLQRGDPEYPLEFEDLSDPPKQLFGYGNPSILGGGLAIVGARKATPYGLACARRFSVWTAGQGIPVVSGAAMGCDLESHRAALSVGGPTVAVLPGGPDIDYPKRASDVLSQVRIHGAVISEAPWGSLPQRWSFPRRNRLIAALSVALLVVEASLPSGTFSTADHALDIGREVYAVPGSIFAPECRGSNRLIRQGATPITDISELAEALGFDPFEADLTVHSPTPVLAALNTSPMRPDDLAREMSMDIVSTMRVLGALEAAGKIVRYPDGRYGVIQT